jgi:hypothetical protein
VIKGQVKDCTAQMCMSLCIQSTAEILHPLVWGSRSLPSN